MAGNSVRVLVLGLLWLGACSDGDDDDSNEGTGGVGAGGIAQSGGGGIGTGGRASGGRSNGGASGMGAATNKGGTGGKMSIGGEAGVGGDGGASGGVGPGGRGGGMGGSAGQASGGNGASGGEPEGTGGVPVGGGGAGGAGGGGAGGDGGGTVSFACPASDWSWEDWYPESDRELDIMALWGASPTDVWESRGQHGLIHHFDGSEWTEVGLSAGNVVRAFYGTAANDVWAVGTGGLVAHWNGSSWSCAPPLTGSTLVDVWASGPNDVWAVGDGELSASRTTVTPTVLHFNGTSWSRNALTWVNSSPQCSYTDVQRVWGSGATDVWVSFRARCPGNLGTNSLVSRWNGTAWTEMRRNLATAPSHGAGFASAPNNAIVLLGVDQLGPSAAYAAWNGTDWANSTDTTRYNDVWGSSANDIWFAAHGALVHWNGTSFASTALGGRSLSGTSATNAWLYGHGGARYHFAGTTWADFSSTMSAPPPRGEGVSFIWGSGSDAVWGVTNITGRVLRSVGDEWVSTSSPAGLRAVWGTGPNSLWAVGSNDVVHYYNGVSWTQSSTNAGVELTGIWGTAANDIWAVGSAKAEAGVVTRYYTTTLHFDGTNWTRVAVEAPGAGTSQPLNLLAVHGTTANNVWAVGLGTTLQWNGTTWVSSSGGGHRVWVGGPAPSDVRVFNNDAPESGTGSSDRWSVTGQRLQVLQWNGATPAVVNTGLDQSFTSGTYALWVGAEDVYIGTDNGVTMRMKR